MGQVSIPIIQIDWGEDRKGLQLRQQYLNKMEMNAPLGIIPSFDYELYTQAQQRGCYDSECCGSVLWLVHEYHFIFREMKRDPLTIPLHISVFHKYEIVLKEYLKTGDCKKAMQEQEI